MKRHRCRRCNKPLTDEESIKLGIGPICRLKESLEYDDWWGVVEFCCMGGSGFSTTTKLNMPSETAKRIELPPSKEARAPKHKGGRESSSEGIPSPRHHPAPHLNMIVMYGIADESNTHHDTSRTERGAKNWATRNGFSIVTRRVGYSAVWIAQKVNGKWVAVEH